MSDLLTTLIARRRMTDGGERALIEQMILHLEREGRRIVTDEDLQGMLDARPGQVFEWLHRQGFKFNGGQQRKRNVLLGVL